jgi:hypothetical protein
MRFQIKIKSPKSIDNAYELFEDIQNRYGLYDNCVLDFRQNNIPDYILIESTDKDMLKELIEKIRAIHKNLNIKLIKISDKNTILDEDRKEETGGLPV